MQGKLGWCKQRHRLKEKWQPINPHRRLILVATCHLPSAKEGHSVASFPEPKTYELPRLATNDKEHGHEEGSQVEVLSVEKMTNLAGGVCLAVGITDAQGGIDLAYLVHT